jgi:hypothetical protein
MSGWPSALKPVLSETPTLLTMQTSFDVSNSEFQQSDDEDWSDLNTDSSGSLSELEGTDLEECLKVLRVEA